MVDKKILILHIFVLCLQLIALFGFSIPQILKNFPFNLSQKLFTVVVVTDLLVQLVIGYICWTMGATEKLNKFDV